MIKKFLYFIIILLIIFFGILILGNLINGVPKDKTIAVGYFSALFYTFIFGFLLRRKLQQFFSKFNNKELVFVVIGSIGAIFIETVIWSVQTYLKTKDAAIHPNLIVDLVMTMPFYSLLCYFVAKWVIKYSFSWPTIALAGGIYEAGADGFVGNLVQLNILGAFMSPILLPMFIIVYSPIILVPYLIVPRTSLINPNRRDYLILLKPLWALVIVPFSLILGLILASILK